MKASAPFDSRETAAILAGLRLLQDVYTELNKKGRFHNAEIFTWTAFVTPHPFVDILTNGGTLEPLNSSEIDTLCERINTSALQTPDYSI